MKVLIVVIFVFGAGIYMAIKGMKESSSEVKLKKWAQKNNLKYQKKVKLGFINSENVALESLIWGEYNGRKVYFFKVINSTGQFSQSHVYFNGNFYSKIEPEDIDQLLSNKNYLETMPSIFGDETETEIVQVLVSQVYLHSEIETEHKTVKEIRRLLQKFYNSKTSFKDKLVGGLFGSVRSDVKFNCLEAINFVAEKNGKLDKKIIEEVANAYENLLSIYHQKTQQSSENPLQNVDTSKFQ